MLDSTTLFPVHSYYSDGPAELIKLQSECWDPLHHVLNFKYGIKLRKTKSLFGLKQDESTMKAIRTLLSQMTPIRLAAMERAVLLFKSIAISLLLINKDISLGQAIKAHTVELDSQIQKWGHIEDSHDVDEANMKRWAASISLSSEI